LIIIVEGPEGLGKSTLSRELGDRLKCPVYKDMNSETGMELSRDYISGHDTGSVGMALAMSRNSDIILDRSFLSEAAYSYAFRRPFDSKLYGLLDWKISEVKHLGVLVWSHGREEGFEMAAERGMRELKKNDWLRVWDGYHYYVKHSPMEWLTVYSDEPVVVSAKAVMRRIGR